MIAKLLQISKEALKLITKTIFPRKLRFKVLRTVSNSPVLCSFFAVYSGWLGREAKSILRGQLAHSPGRTCPKTSAFEGAIYTLRRNTHRLEKGLIMRPRKPIFALDYIQPTIDVYRTVLENNSGDEQNYLLKWSFDVLTTYFASVENHAVIENAKSQFDSLNHNPSVQKSKWIPYTRETSPLNISVQDLKKLAIRRRSCRWFLQKPVPREIIDTAIEIAGYAPSACNRQPFEFRIYDDSSVKSLAAIPMGTKGFSDNFPCIVIVVGTHAAFPFPRDRHLPYIDSCLAVMGFQFALEVQGLSSCCINWPDIPNRETALREKIELEDHEFVVMFIAVGYPDPKGLVPYSQKKTLDLIRSYNKGLKC